MIYVDGKKPSRIFLYEGNKRNIVNKVVAVRGTTSETVWEMFPRTCSPSLALGSYGTLDFAGCSLKEPLGTLYDGSTSRVMADYSCTARPKLFGGDMYDLSYAKDRLIHLTVTKATGFPNGASPINFAASGTIDAKLYICPVGGRVVRRDGKIDVESSDLVLTTRKLSLRCIESLSEPGAAVYGELALKDGDYIVYTTGDAITGGVSATLRMIDPE